MKVVVPKGEEEEEEEEDVRLSLDWRL